MLIRPKSNLQLVRRLCGIHSRTRGYVVTAAIFSVCDTCPRDVSTVGCKARQSPTLLEVWIGQICPRFVPSNQDATGEAPGRQKLSGFLTMMLRATVSVALLALLVFSQPSDAFIDVVGTLKPFYDNLDSTSNFDTVWPYPVQGNNGLRNEDAQTETPCRLPSPAVLQAIRNGMNSENEEIRKSFERMLPIWDVPRYVRSKKTFNIIDELVDAIVPDLIDVIEHVDSGAGEAWRNTISPLDLDLMKTMHLKVYVGRNNVAPDGNRLIADMDSWEFKGMLLPQPGSAVDASIDAHMDTVDAGAGIFVPLVETTGEVELNGYGKFRLAYEQVRMGWKLYKSLYELKTGLDTVDERAKSDAEAQDQQLYHLMQGNALGMMQRNWQDSALSPEDTELWHWMTSAETASEREARTLARNAEVVDKMLIAIGVDKGVYCGPEKLGQNKNCVHVNAFDDNDGGAYNDLVVLAFTEPNSPGETLCAPLWIHDAPFRVESRVGVWLPMSASVLAVGGAGAGYAMYRREKQKRAAKRMRSRSVSSNKSSKSRRSTGSRRSASSRK